MTGDYDLPHDSGVKIDAFKTDDGITVMKIYDTFVTSPIENNQELREKLVDIIVRVQSHAWGMGNQTRDMSQDTKFSEATETIMSLIEQALVDELKHIDDPVNVRLYFNGLISVADRIAQLQDNQGASNE